MVLWAVIAMVVLGLLFGAGLILAARAFALHENPRIGEVEHLLPGINCGACGFSGCHAYAEAVVCGEKITLCTTGGPDVAKAVAALMGVEVGSMRRLRAVVHCQGGSSKCGQRFQYAGDPDCRSAQILAGGPKACTYGCLGYSSCARACPFGAIRMNAEMLPVVNPAKCTACGICVRVCPRDLITLVPADCKIHLGCSSHDKGKAVKDVCSVGCIACGLCAKKDPHGAIRMADNLPVPDYDRSGGDFSVAAQVCPMGCFIVEEGAPLAASPAGEAAAGRA